jgi:hypothetical protein
VGLERVKRHSLHSTFHVLERRLRMSLARLVDPYRSLSRARRCKHQRAGQPYVLRKKKEQHPSEAARTDGGEIIAFSMERDLIDLS